MSVRYLMAAVGACLLVAEASAAAPATVRGPVPIFRALDLSDEPSLLAEGVELPVLEETVVFLEGRPGGDPTIVKRRVTVYTLAAPDGTRIHASPDIGVRDDPRLGGRAIACEFPPNRSFLGGGIVALMAAAACSWISWRRRARADSSAFALLGLGFGAAALGFFRAGAWGSFATIDGDELQYLEWAGDLAAGRPLTPSGFGIGWPLLLAPLFRALHAPADPAAAIFVLAPFSGAVVSGGTAVVTALMAQRLWGSRARGILAGVAWATWVTFVRHPHFGWPPGPHVGRSCFAWDATASPWSLDLYYWAVRSGWSALSDAPTALLIAIAASLGFTALAREHDGGSGRLAWIGAGLAAGWALSMRVAAIIPVAILGTCLVLQAFRRPAPNRWRTAMAWGGLAAALAYLPQLFVNWSWTGSPLRTAYSINEHDLAMRVRPLFSLQRAASEGLAFYASYHAPLLAVTGIALCWPALRGGRLARGGAVTLAVTSAAVLLAMAAFAYGTHQPARLVLPAIPLLFAGMAGWGLGSEEAAEPRGLLAIPFLLAVVAWVPGFPLPPELGLPLPRWLALAAPLVLIIVAAAGTSVRWWTRREAWILCIAVVAAAVSGWLPWVAGAALVAPIVVAALPRRMPDATTAA